MAKPVSAKNGRLCGDRGVGGTNVAEAVISLKNMQEAKAEEAPTTPFNPREFQQRTASFIESIDAYAKRLDAMGLVTGMPLLDASLEGFQPGFHMVAAESNVGKSNFTAQILWGILKNNPRAVVLDLSLDDPYLDRLARVGASATQMPINVFRRPKQFLDNKEFMQRRARFVKAVKEKVSHRYWMEDSTTHSTDIAHIEATIQKAKITLEYQARKQKKDRVADLVVFIDSFHDLSADTFLGPTVPSIQKYDYLAQEMSRIASQYDVCIITTGELRKLNALRRPSENDIRDTVKIRFELKTLLLGYSDVATRKEGAKIYFERDGLELKQPIVEWEIAKNKQSAVKRRLFYYCFSEMAYFEEVGASTASQYLREIYG